MIYNNPGERFIPLMTSMGYRPKDKGSNIKITTKHIETLYIESRDGPVDEWIRGIEESQLLLYRKVDLENLKKRVHAPGGHTGIVSLIDLLHRVKSLPDPITLDPDQVIAVQMSATTPKLLVYGPPGAGKTHVLAKIGLQHLSRDPFSRVLFLVFNVNAEKTMKLRLEKLGCSSGQLFAGVSRAQCRNPAVPGCFVMTFDKYVARRQVALDSFSLACLSNVGESSYTVRYRAGLAAGPQSWENWSRVIVDEMQDLKRAHMDLIDQLKPKFYVEAGDPRQELYENTGFMSEHWRNADKYCFKTCVLRYNHRSKPVIVHALNEFSRTHFGNLHVDQIPAREPGGGITAAYPQRRTDLDDQAQDITKHLLKHGVGACLISPVSIRKYRTHQIVVSTRQAISDNSRGSAYGRTLDEEGTLVREPGVICIGNSYSFKGYEEDVVVLIQGDVPYEELNLTRERAIRCIFVSLSRARDWLHVSLSEPLRPHGLLSCLNAEFLKTVVSTKVGKVEMMLPTSLDVCDDLAKNLTFPVLHHTIHPMLAPVRVTSETASDYLGMVVEGLVAQSMGVPGPNPTLYKIEHVASSGEEGVAQEDEAGVICVRKVKEKYVLKLLRVHAMSGDNREQLLAKLRMTVKAGREWTIGYDFDSDIIEQGVTAFASTNDPGVARSRKIKHKIVAHRSDVWLGVVNGITEVETERDIVSVKHRRPGDYPEGLRQLAVYSALTGKGGALYRSQEGLVDRIQVPELRWVELLSRACLGLRQAMCRRHHLTVAPSIQIGSSDRIAISVDIETIPRESGQILEVGAVAFRMDTGRPVDVFHQLAVGVVELAGSTDTNGVKLGYYGFDEVNTNFTHVANDQCPIRDAFRHWVQRFPEGSLLCQFSGNDAKTLGIHGMASLDARTLFKEWLTLSGNRRNNKTTLDDAVTQLFGTDRLFVPHRAFEDAVATAMVIAALFR